MKLLALFFASVFILLNFGEEPRDEKDDGSDSERAELADRQEPDGDEGFDEKPDRRAHHARGEEHQKCLDEELTRGIVRADVALGNIVVEPADLENVEPEVHTHHDLPEQIHVRKGGNENEGKNHGDENRDELCASGEIDLFHDL